MILASLAQGKEEADRQISGRSQICWMIDTPFEVF
jgi:hypothetical protein